jgi:ribosome-associated protein
LADVRVNRRLTIPENELRFTFSTSGGPGGQHANRAATRAELEWNVAESRVLGPRQRDLIMSRLRRRIDSSGVLRLASDRYRSQYRNRQDACRRLATLVAEALRPATKRIDTAPTRASKERRLQAKRRRGEIKRARRPPSEE